MSFLSRIFTGAPEERTITRLNGIPSPMEDYAMRGGGDGGTGAMSLGAFYACVTLLADTVSTLSIKAYKEKDEVRVPVVPEPAIMKTPYPGLSWFDWLWMLMESLAVTGNAFGYISAQGKDGRASAILPLLPDCVSVEDPQDDGVEPVYRYNGKIVPNWRIMHIRRYPIAGRAIGMSPVQKAAAAIGLGLAAERYGLRYFKDSANPSGILATDSDLSPEQVKQTQKNWILSHQNRRLPAVMSGGIKWQSISLTPNESQFLETRGFQRSEIAMWFRVPPHMIGHTADGASNWGTGIEQQSIGFVTYTLNPWLTCIEQALSTFLPNGQFVKFNIDGLLRGDVKARWEAYKAGRDAGVYSVNDINRLEDRPPIGPEGDIRLQPMNFIPLGTPVSEYLGKNEPSPPAEEGKQ